VDKDKNRELELASTASPVKLDVKDLLRKKLFAAVRHAHNFQAGHQLDHVQNHAAEASLSVFVFV